EIDGGSSHLSQNSTVAHFGLGDATVVDSVVVHWIGGESQRVTNVALNQINTINQETTTRLGGGELDLTAFPTSFQNELYFTYNLPSTGPARVDLVDVTGRVVAKLLDTNDAAPTFFDRWQPQGDVAAGIYYLRLIHDGETKSIPVQRVR
ncbi:MAG: ASPIC/UnbV domain-containing protein, partial [Bacteroidota bacterium]